MLNVLTHLTRTENCQDFPWKISRLNPAWEGRGSRKKARLHQIDPDWADRLGVHLALIAMEDISVGFIVWLNLFQISQLSPGGGAFQGDCELFGMFIDCPRNRTGRTGSALLAMHVLRPSH
ncbi:hypothetical protein [Pseudomonas boanensis]|uniref:hypothetical protein n=1 Tax=Metapseudomonas boanensis TaxID=2822138 RepID=UPI0035D4623B